MKIKTKNPDQNDNNEATRATKTSHASIIQVKQQRIYSNPSELSNEPLHDVNDLDSKFVSRMQKHD